MTASGILGHRIAELSLSGHFNQEDTMSKKVRDILTIIAMALIVPLAIYFIIVPIVLRYFGMK
jgi:hypothetical protein